MEYQIKKYFVIVDDTNGGYWDRMAKRFRGIVFATEYESNSAEEIEMIIVNDPDIKKGYYSVRKVIQKSKADE
jgi:hypothetical protein